MPTDPAHDMPDLEPLQAKLTEMERIIEQQRTTLNTLETELNHFKSAFEEADAERQRLELVQGCSVLLRNRGMNAEWV